MCAFRSLRMFAWTLLMWLSTAGAAPAQEAAWFAGGIAGVSALSADARAVVAPATVAVSMYAPETGPALNVLIGRHLREYVSFQANYLWNRNDLALVGVQVIDEGASFYEQARHSSQHALVGDMLVYFRARRSRLRPYLSTGVGVIRFKSRAVGQGVVRRSVLPPDEFVQTQTTLRVAVGMDVVIRRGWRVRYSFSESLSRNPISAQLSPQAPRNLANFQNLVGLLREF